MYVCLPILFLGSSASSSSSSTAGSGRGPPPGVRMPGVQNTNIRTNVHQFISQAGDSGHETLLSDDDSPTPTVERASSEVIYSTIANGNHHVGRSRRSLAESTNATCINIKSNINNVTTATTANIINNNFEQGVNLVNTNNNNNNNEEEHPPMIGVPNLKGKALIRPIAFRPTPGPNSGASIPTNGPLGSFRPGSSNGNNESLVQLGGLLARASPAQGPFNVPVPQTQSAQQNGNSSTSEGFAPGHPLVKDGRRHYGSSQELHVAAPISTNPAFNKFNSLDRRALDKRQTGNNGLLKLATPTSASGSESLP